MDVSIIIVNWNTREILLECIDSLERYGIGCNMEIIVVDNGSSDGSQEAVRDRFPKVKLIENGGNLGFAKANNIGMKQAVGRYLCLINSDVMVREGCIDCLVSYMDDNPGIGMVGPKILNPDMTLQDSCRRFPSLWTHFVLAMGLDKLFPNSKIFFGEHMIHFPHDQEQDVDYIAGCFMMTRREAFDQIGQIDERFFIYQEEVDWCRRLWQVGWKVTFYPGAEAFHYHALSSKKDPVRFSVERQKAIIQYWGKYYGRVSNICLLIILFIKHVIRLVSRYLFSYFLGNKNEKSSVSIAKDRACLAALIQYEANKNYEQL